MTESRYALIVDDDANLAELISGVLADERQTRSFHVSCGDEALDFLRLKGRFSRETDTSPKVIFLDVEMRGKDGLEVLKLIKEDLLLKHIPVVMLAGALSGEKLRHCYALGANAYVVKPADFREFSSSMRTLGSFWLSVNEVP